MTTLSCGHGSGVPAGYPFHLVCPQNQHVTQRLRVCIDWLVACFPAKVAGEGESGT